MSQNLQIPDASEFILYSQQPHIEATHSITIGLGNFQQLFVGITLTTET